MNRCARQSLVQDYLDGLLGPAEAAEFERHAAGCADCHAEIALYRRVFAALDGAATWDPGPLLTERVLDRVLPSRVRRHRRLVALGWAYSVALAGSLGGLLALVNVPLGRAGIAALSGEASHRLFQTLKFVLDAFGWVAVRTADVARWSETVAQRAAPVMRGIGAVLQDPTVALVLTAAAAACAGMMWWMRPRERAGAKEVRHVGLIGF